MREFPGKGRKHCFGYDEAALKDDVQAHAWSCISRTVRIISLTSDATAIRLKACVLVHGGYFEH